MSHINIVIGRRPLWTNEIEYIDEDNYICHCIYDIIYDKIISLHMNNKINDNMLVKYTQELNSAYKELRRFYNSPDKYKLLYHKLIETIK